MDGSHFDDVTRAFTHSRRSLVTGALAAITGLLIGTGADAKKTHKHTHHKQPKLRRNAFGCVAVGGACQGNSANCCSGICEGTKPKKGKKDTSVCIAHDDAGVCFADSDSCTVATSVPCHPGNESCFCVKTTGDAGFCGDFTAGPAALCRECEKDADCQANLGPGAACVFLDGVCSPYCAEKGRTACVLPCPGEAA